MARNEEKQQGRLNRLWLQKEREEGRLRDIHERRPKLSTLNSAAAVKKWIPSIKNEIEYYLQQSQLSHYPERKIGEFQLHIEALEKEYKRFIAKLRVLDPSCKHKPWTPRAYCKRRADMQDSPGIGKYGNGHTYISRLVSETSKAICAVQDQPLSFDQTRLAVAAASFRGTPVQPSSSQTQSLARILQCGFKDGVSETVGQKAAFQENNSNCGAAGRIPGKSSNIETMEERTGHVLGLDCYSSSDDDSDT
uniref:Si:dkey-86e18.1 n=1 Tax=Neolamprologus brichardi TaxID=32507 RepID=A0A3Q4IFV7_NEOBR